MRTHYLFPLLSGLLLSGLTACGDDSSSTDDDSTDDVTNDAGGDTTATATDPSDTDPTDTDPTDTDTDTGGTVDVDGGEPTGGGDTDGGVDGGGEPTGGGDTDGGVDGGGEPTGGGDVDGGDGGELTEGGVDGADGGDSAAPLPEGACAAGPADPEDGTYAECDGTLNAGTCQLTCTDNDFIGGQATCVDGEWIPAECVPLGSLEATIGDAATGDAIEGATVYVEGFFDPATQECADSEYCAESDANGAIDFDAFPTGPQNVVIVADGYDQIALPIEIAPGSTSAVRLDALPTDFLNGNYVVILGWRTAPNQKRDLDLVVSAPVPESDGGAVNQCVHWQAPGDLSALPYAFLANDTDDKDPSGAETVQIRLNDAEDGPYTDGTYSVVISSYDYRGFASSNPAVRLISAGENGAANVQLFNLPEDSATANTWHVFDLNGDGSVTVNGQVETLDEGGASGLPCVDEAHGL